jgi:hypothetical protein
MGDKAKWKERLPGLEGLSDEPRPGAPRKLTEVQVEEAVTRTLESWPVAATHGSALSLAEAVGLSQSAVSANRAQFWLAAAPE